MSSRGHNKKRNTGLLYEFLIKAISSNLVAGDQKKSSTALRILKRFFKPGTELHKEFRLINALVKTTVSSDAVAMSILNETKDAAKHHDVRELDRQKSLLIRSINHTLQDPEFYDRPVFEYRTYATIQTLLNDWRQPSRDIERSAQYEDQIVSWLLTEKHVPEEQVIMTEGPGTSRLLMKVLMQKLNEKYSGLLTEVQKSLIRTYAWSSVNDDEDVIRMKLDEIRSSLLASAGDYKTRNPSDEYVCKQLDEVSGELQNENLDAVDDDTVTRFLLYVQLHEELTTGE